MSLGLTPLSLSKRQATLLVYEKMEMTGCHHFADRLYPSLSGGERQRVQLARVLLQLSQAEQKPLLLLDEPTSAQDLGQQHSILKLAQHLAHEEKFGIIAILHDLNQVLKYCDRCYLLEEGKVIEKGRPEKVLTPNSVNKHWGYMPEQITLDTGHLALI